jgi:hypothetical protein
VIAGPLGCLQQPSANKYPLLIAVHSRAVPLRCAHAPARTLCERGGGSSRMVGRGRNSHAPHNQLAPKPNQSHLQLTTPTHKWHSPVPSPPHTPRVLQYSTCMRKCSVPPISMHSSWPPVHLLMIRDHGIETLDETRTECRVSPFAPSGRFAPPRAHTHSHPRRAHHRCIPQHDNVR